MMPAEYTKREWNKHDKNDNTTYMEMGKATQFWNGSEQQKIIQHPHTYTEWKK